jgi:NAD(P)H-flavin reductase
MAAIHKNNAGAGGSHPDAMTARPFSIRRIIRETDDTFSMELTPCEGTKSFTFTPGQFDMLYVYGVGEVPISISGDPSETGTLVHTTREVGAVTGAMKKLRVGDTLGVRGPYGKGWPVKEAEGCDVVIVAGGIGLAPLRPVIYYLLTHREKYGKIGLLYGSRCPEELLYLKNLDKWQSLPDIETRLTVDRATGRWRGNVGVVTTLIPRASFDAPHTMALVCGPEIMMRFTVPELQKRGVADEKIFISMERNMKCGVGLCGHCQLGASFVCKDGPVYRYDEMKDIFAKREM